MNMDTRATQTVLVGFFVLLALFILSFAASFAIGKVLQDVYLGFVIVGAFYILIAILCYIFRSKLNKPLLRKFSKHYFD